MKKHFGKCALCGNDCELTFEHVPPRSSFNSTPVRAFSGDSVFDEDCVPWDTTGLQYDSRQRGLGKYSLCQTCNNNTGAWYGEDYKAFANIMHRLLAHPSLDKGKGFRICDIHPLRFVKQVASMFCSVNNFVGKRVDALREFVLDKNRVGLDKTRYKICMYFTKSNMTKLIPRMVVMKNTKAGLEAMALSEITAYPFGFILYFDPTETYYYDGLDITHFSDCEYDDIAEIIIPKCIYEMNDVFPTYYRSKDEILRCREENKKWTEENDDNANQ